MLREKKPRSVEVAVYLLGFQLSNHTIEELEQLRLVASKLLILCCDPYNTFFLARQFSLPSHQVDPTSQYFQNAMELTNRKTETEAETEVVVWRLSNISSRSIITFVD